LGPGGPETAPPGPQKGPFFGRKSGGLWPPGQGGGLAGFTFPRPFGPESRFLGPQGAPIGHPWPVLAAFPCFLPFLALLGPFWAPFGRPRGLWPETRQAANLGLRPCPVLALWARKGPKGPFSRPSGPENAEERRLIVLLRSGWFWGVFGPFPAFSAPSGGPRPGGVSPAPGLGALRGPFSGPKGPKTRKPAQNTSVAFGFFGFFRWSRPLGPKRGRIRRVFPASGRKCLFSGLCVFWFRALDPPWAAFSRAPPGTAPRTFKRAQKAPKRQRAPSKSALDWPHGASRAPNPD